MQLGRNRKRQIYHHMGHVDISRSNLWVAKDVLKVKGIKDAPKKMRFACVRYALRCHRDNRNLYGYVMYGRKPKMDINDIRSRMVRCRSGSPVDLLVQAVDREAKKRGYTLSRWQSHKGPWIVEITYAIHSGRRPDKSTLIPPADLVAKVHLAQPEGSTERCIAHRVLSGLLMVACGLVAK